MPYYNHDGLEPGYMQRIVPDCHVQVPALSLIGKGPKGDQGEKGDPGDYKEEELIEIIENVYQNIDLDIEVNKIDGKCIYTLFTFPKDKYRVDLDLVVKNQTLVAGQQIQQSGFVSDYALENRPLLVCNVNPSANVYFNNVLYGNDWSGSSDGTSGVFGTTADGFPYMKRGGNFSDVFNLVKSAIGVWQPLRMNGVNEDINPYATFQTPNPRQTFAMDDDNYYLFTAYARINSLRGLTFQEVLNFGVARGWTDIYCFDSGGSNQVFSGDPFTSFTVNLTSKREWRPQYMLLVFSERS